MFLGIGLFLIAWGLASSNAGFADAPTIVCQPSSRTLTPGETEAALGVVATGTPPLSYQWKKDGTDVSGGTNANLYFPAVDNGQAGTYWCVVSDGGGTVTSNTAGLTVSTATPQVFYVDKNNAEPLGRWNGDSWEVAFKTLQEGIDAAANAGGGEVWVAAGVYDEPRALDGTLFLRGGVHLYGGFGGIGTYETSRDQRDLQHHDTVIDGSKANGGGAARHVILAFENDIVLDGFKVTGGNATGENEDMPGGGGMLILLSSPIVRNCLFVDNQETPILGGGGGIMAYMASAPLISSVTFRGCSGAAGGGFCSNVASSVIVNSLFIRNHGALAGGGAASCEAGGPLYLNCTFWGNTTDGAGNDCFNYGTNTFQRMLNSILYSADDGIFNYEGGDCAVTYCDVKGGYDGTGNIDEDPQFIAAAGGNLRIEQDSACVDAGGPDGARPARDLEGRQRPMGSGVDMGAYESGPLELDRSLEAVICSQTTPCPATFCETIHAISTVHASYASVQELDPKLPQIRSLAGLECAGPALVTLDLSNNDIRDITALVENTELGAGTTIDLSGNRFLSQHAIYVDIPILEDRGIIVKTSLPLLPPEFRVPRKYPRLCNNYQLPWGALNGGRLPSVDEEEAALSKWDVVITWPFYWYLRLGSGVDEVQKARAAMANIRAMHPDMSILAFVPTYGILLGADLLPGGFDPHLAPDAMLESCGDSDCVGAFWEQYFLTDGNGNNVCFPPAGGVSYPFVNPWIERQGYGRWGDLMPSRVNAVYGLHGDIFDGVFCDLLYPSKEALAVFPGLGGADVGGDGVSNWTCQGVGEGEGEGEGECDLTLWNRGINYYIDKMRDVVGEDGLIVANTGRAWDLEDLNRGADSLYARVNGCHYESALGAELGGSGLAAQWQDVWSHYHGLYSNSASPTAPYVTHPAYMISADTEYDLPEGTSGVDATQFGQGDYQRVRLGLGTTLMHDGYFEYCAGGEAQLWWFDEYNARLGDQVGPVQTTDESKSWYSRGFENGAAFVNGNTSTLLSAVPDSVAFHDLGCYNTNTLGSDVGRVYAQLANASTDTRAMDFCKIFHDTSYNRLARTVNVPPLDARILDKHYSGQENVYVQHVYAFPCSDESRRATLFILKNIVTQDVTARVFVEHDSATSISGGIYTGTPGTGSLAFELYGDGSSIDSVLSKEVTSVLLDPSQVYFEIDGVTTGAYVSLDGGESTVLPAFATLLQMAEHNYAYMFCADLNANQIPDAIEFLLLWRAVNEHADIAAVFHANETKIKARLEGALGAQTIWLPLTCYATLGQGSYDAASAVMNTLGVSLATTGGYDFSQSELLHGYIVGAIDGLQHCGGG